MDKRVDEKSGEAVKRLEAELRKTVQSIRATGKTRKADAGHSGSPCLIFGGESKTGYPKGSNGEARIDVCKHSRPVSVATGPTHLGF